jgi:hypothetical protein
VDPRLQSRQNKAARTMSEVLKFLLARPLNTHVVTKRTVLTALIEGAAEDVLPIGLDLQRLAVDPLQGAEEGEGGDHGAASAAASLVS